MTDVDPTVEAPQDEPATTVSRRPVRWYDLAIAAIFGLFFAYLVWAAIGNAINFPQLFDAVRQPGAVPWWLLITAIAIPILIYVVAFIISMRRSPLITALVFLMALGVASALGYSAVGIGAYLFAQLPPVQ